MRKTTCLVIVLTLSFGVILASTTSSGLLIVFAQSNQTNSSPPSSLTNQSISSSLSRSSPASTPHITKIKITSPTRGQQVPVGKDLTVSGISIDNATSNCQISVIVDKVRPYQPATATGNGGTADYSKWNFVLTSKYTTIKPGQNRITAKYACVNNPDLTGFSSVNVTGVPASAIAAAATSLTNQSISSSPSSVIGANQTAAKQQPANNTGSSSAGKNTTSATGSAANKTSAGASSSASNASGGAQGQNNNSSNPLAKIPIIGKIFGG